MIGLAVSFLLVTQSAPGLTPQDVQARIASAGARATVGDLYRSGQWDEVDNGIGSGNQGWIALAPRLAEGTDAATAEGLSIALAEALPRNPKAVLAVLDPQGFITLRPQQVCTAPFIEDTPEHQASYKAAARSALATVTDSRLMGVRDACLADLNG